jgi:hypothetical protein
MRWWVPWLLGASRATGLLHRGTTALRDAVLATRLSLPEQEALTLALYQEATTYSPGGSAFEQGLFPWEQRLLEHPAWPTTGPILVGAAGAGREALALVRRGHKVVAFEPCAPLAAQGRALAKVTPGLSFFEGSYADLSALAASPHVPPDQGKSKTLPVQQGHPTPHALEDPPGQESRPPRSPLLDGAPFCAAVLGWGSLSHVLDGGQRLALLRSLRHLVPAGPVVMSFLVAWPRGGFEDRLHRALQRRAGNDAPHFSPEAGFFHLFTAPEVEALAAASGYRVAHYQEDPYPHALLLPAG